MGNTTTEKSYRIQRFNEFDCFSVGYVRVFLYIYITKDIKICFRLGQ